MHQLVLSLDRFCNAMMDNLERFIELKDTSGVGTIWTSCVTSLGHLAALCHLTGQTVSNLRSSMFELCDLTLDKLVSLSHEVHMEEYSQFDVLTGVRIFTVPHRMSEALTKSATQISWKRALDTIDALMESRPHAESGPLRYWRAAIGKAYTDTRLNPLEDGPSLLISSTLLMDGRMEGSRYPNLLLPEERAPYGL